MLEHTGRSVARTRRILTQLGEAMTSRGVFEEAATKLQQILIEDSLSSPPSLKVLREGIKMTKMQRKLFLASHPGTPNCFKICIENGPN